MNQSALAELRRCNDGLRQSPSERVAGPSAQAEDHRLAKPRLAPCRDGGAPRNPHPHPLARARGPQGHARRLRQLPRRHLFHDDQRDDDRLRRHRPGHRPDAHVRRDRRHPDPHPLPADPRRLGLCVRRAAFLGKIHHEANPAHPLRPHHRRRLRHQEQPRREGADRPRLRAAGHRRHRHQRRPAREGEGARLHGAQGRCDPRRDAARPSTSTAPS